MNSTRNTGCILRYHSREYAPLSGLTAPNVRAYCERWGYDFVDLFMPLEPWHSGVIFQVISSYLGIYPWILAMGADVLIANPEISVESRLSPNHEVLIASEHLGPGGSPLNADVLLYRSGPGATWFLNTLQTLAPSYIDHPRKWQQAIVDLIAKAKTPLPIGVVPARFMNSHPHHFPCGTAYPRGPGTFEEGDWILHFLCGKHEQKCAAVTRFLEHRQP